MKKILKKKMIKTIAYASVCALGVSALAVAAVEGMKVPSATLENACNVVMMENDSVVVSKKSAKVVAQKDGDAAKATQGLYYNYVEVIEEVEGERVVTDKYYVLRSIGVCDSTELVIPDYIVVEYDNGTEISSIPVRAIHPFAFKGNTNITSVVIPETVEVIGADAFRGCTSLEKVEMPKNLGVRVYGDEDKANKGKLLDGTIERGAFSNCYALKAISIPANVKVINNDTFSMCSSLEKVNLHNEITEIGKYAFDRCNSLTDIKLNTTKITRIGDGAFHYCTAIQKLELPTSLTRIGKSAFAGCSGLQEVSLPNPTAKDAKLTVDKYAFAYCDNVKTVSISENTALIEDNAFAACISLTKFTVDSKNKTYEEAGGNLYTEDKKTLMQYALGKADKTFTVSATVEIVADAAFAAAPNLESVIFEYEAVDGDEDKGVKVIRENAFYSCPNLSKVVLCSTLVEIGENAFRNCDKLETLVIVPPKAADLFELPSQYTQEMDIRNYAFNWCDSLKKVYVQGDWISWKLKVNFGILTGLDKVDVYYYTETQPTEEGCYWYYQDGEITVWEVQDEVEEEQEEQEENA